MRSANTPVDGQPHDLYAQAQAAREQSQLLAAQLRVTQRKISERWQLLQAAWDQSERIRAEWLVGYTDPDQLRFSAYARLQARLASMPVIEQAKGIIMGKYGWPEDRAFDALRQASQRKNVKLRDLAAGIVAQAARPAPGQEQTGSASTALRSGDGPIPRIGSSGPRDRYRASA
jgi:hypothetical protein